MKKLLNILLILIIITSVGYSWHLYSLTPCDQVLEYSIGRFDNSFGVAEASFKEYIKRSEEPWEGALAKELFVYKPDASFKINLIFDERQKETVAKQKTESGLTAIENSFRALDAKFQLAKKEYEIAVARHETMKAEYERKVALYEAEVKKWNSKGGASRSKFDELEAQREALNRSADALNSETGKLSLMTENLNSLVRERNNAAENYNKAVEAYNDKYGGHAEFDQAEYNGKAINIYQFSDSKSLVEALAHELGHALSMEHVENPKSIMYYLRDSDNTLAVPTPSPEDLAELKRVCRL